MLRGIVLGDLWGLERHEWIELWAGLFGAVPAAVLSAVVAAFVAMFVLDRSNKHQQKLVEKQLGDQRNEVALSREKTAMADLVGAANKFLSFGIGNDPDLVGGATASFISASFRWALETGEAGNVKVLLRCSGVLIGAGTMVSMSGAGAAGAEKLDAVHATSKSVLNEMVGLVSNFGLRWYLQPAGGRPDALQFLSSEAERLQGRMDSLVESVRGWTTTS